MILSDHVSLLESFGGYCVMVKSKTVANGEK